MVILFIGVGLDCERIGCLVNGNITACSQSMYTPTCKQELELLLKKAVFLVVWGLSCEIIQALLYSLLLLGVVAVVESVLVCSRSSLLA